MSECRVPSAECRVADDALLITHHSSLIPSRPPRHHRSRPRPALRRLQPFRTLLATGALLCGAGESVLAVAVAGGADAARLHAGRGSRPAGARHRHHRPLPDPDSRHRRLAARGRGSRARGADGQDRTLPTADRLVQRQGDLRALLRSPAGRLGRAGSAHWECSVPCLCHAIVVGACERGAGRS